MDLKKIKKNTFKLATQDEAFSDVTKPAKHSHAQCNVCGILRGMRRLHSNSQSEVAQINELITQHKGIHVAEQKSLLVRQIQAHFMAGTYLFLGHDGTVTFQWPRIGRRQLKNMSRMKYVDMRVNGLVDFSSDTSIYFYHMKHWYPKSVDVVLTEWYFYILAVKQSNTPSSKAPFLILQLDNYVGDNKNLHVFAFAACLIEWGWFEVVLFCYLVEGHTHWLLDSSHSTHNTGLFRRFITSPIDICKGFNELFKQNMSIGQELTKYRLPSKYIYITLSLPC